MYIRSGKGGTKWARQRGEAKGRKQRGGDAHLGRSVDSLVVNVAGISWPQGTALEGDVHGLLCSLQLRLTRRIQIALVRDVKRAGLRPCESRAECAMSNSGAEAGPGGEGIA